MKFSIPQKKAKFLSLGSNQGDRRENLVFALDEINKVALIKRQSSLYETPALLPEGAPTMWNVPFLNMVVEISTDLSAEGFLKIIHAIEKKRDRVKGKKWAPRALDIDILLWDDVEIKSSQLKIPHPEMNKRSFVLAPLKDLCPQFILAARRLRTHCPQLMGIINITPDSFSDGGQFFTLESFSRHIDLLVHNGVDIIDVGAESTCPGAIPLSAEAEWMRLKPFLEQLAYLKKNQKLFPLISLDTYHPKNARKALPYGIDIINDVSGLSNPEMLSVLKDSNVDYVLSHSLDIPTNPNNNIDGDPVEYLKLWLESKWEILDRNKISGERIIFDPGIGFGKSSLQSQEIIKNMSMFRELPFRILVGDSRKSFFSTFTPAPPRERDIETIGTSLALLEQGVDILRVHDVKNHEKALKGWLHARS